MRTISSWEGSRLTESRSPMTCARNMEWGICGTTLAPSGWPSRWARYSALVVQSISSAARVRTCLGMFSTRAKQSMIGSSTYSPLSRRWCP